VRKASSKDITKLQTKLELDSDEAESWLSIELWRASCGAMKSFMRS